MSRTFSDEISRFLVASPRIIAPLGGEDDLPIRPPLRFGYRVISADHRLSHPGQSTPHPCGFQVQKRCRGHLTIAGSITATSGRAGFRWHHSYTNRLLATGRPSSRLPCTLFESGDSSAGQSKQNQLPAVL